MIYSKAVADKGKCLERLLKYSADEIRKACEPDTMFTRTGELRRLFMDKGNVRIRSLWIMSRESLQRVLAMKGECL